MRCDCTECYVLSKIDGYHPDHVGIGALCKSHRGEGDEDREGSLSWSSNWRQVSVLRGKRPTSGRPQGSPRRSTPPPPLQRLRRGNWRLSASVKRGGGSDNGVDAFLSSWV